MVVCAVSQFLYAADFYSYMSLIIDSVRLRLGENALLNGVFLKVDRGEIVGLFGRNGSGKSTLMKIIFGVIKADFSYLEVDGIPIKANCINKQIQFLPQHGFLPSHLTIKDIISNFCPKNVQNKLFEDFHISPFLSCKKDVLSVGERRIIEIILILNSTSNYVLLDEPFSGLSPLNIEIVTQIIKDVSGKKGIIITDHFYNNVRSVTSSNVLLKDGVIIKINGKEDLINMQYLPQRMRSES